MSASQTAFNPYREWLDVPLTEKPFNPYLLLGLEPLEGNSLKIEAAVNASLKRLKHVEHSANPTLLEEVRGEIGLAARKLQDAKAKRLLDASIRRKTKLRESLHADLLTSHEIVRCGKCDSDNAGDRRFCSKCGDCLWQLCASCSKVGPITETFCGSCGSNLQESLNLKLSAAQKSLVAARSLKDQFQYKEAIHAVESLALSDDPIIDAIIDEALELLNVLTGASSEQAQKCDAIKKTAAEMIERLDFEDALKLLGTVPKPIQDEEIQRLLATCGQRTNEVGQLRSEIKSAFQNKRYLDALQTIDRLLTLTPNDIKLEQNAEKIRDMVCRSARAKLAEQKFAAALELLDRVPDFVHNEEAKKLQGICTELLCLQREVQQSPFATKILMEIALRFAKSTNDAPSIIDTCNKIKTQLKSKPQQPYSIHPVWAPEPSPTFIGPPVDQYCFPQSFRYGDDFDDSQLREYPSEFFTAIGLALQAMEDAAIGVNILGDTNKGILGRLSFGKRAPKAAWGVDVGSSALHAVRMIRDKSGVSFIDKCVRFSHQKSLDRHDVETQRGESIGAFLNEHDLQKEPVCVSMPGRRLLGRFLELPKMSPKQLPQAITFEAQHQFPFSLDQLKWNYHLLGDSTAFNGESDEARNAFQNILLLGAREYDVTKMLTPWLDANIKVQQAQCDCVALHNFMQHEFFGENRWRTLPKETGKDDAVALVDVGAAATNIVVSSPQRLWFRSLGSGATQFSEGLLREFAITFEQSEQLKRDPTKSKRLNRIHSLWSPLMAQLAGEVQRSLTTPGTQNFPLKPHQVFLVGGGSNQHGLLRTLRYGTEK